MPINMTIDAVSFDILAVDLLFSLAPCQGESSIAYLFLVYVIQRNNIFSCLCRIRSLDYGP